MSIVKKGMGIFFTSLLVTGFASSTYAAQDYPFTVIKNRANTVQQVDSLGEKQDAISIDLQVRRDLVGAKRNTQMWYGDFFSDNNGYEKVQVNKRRVKIYSQDGELLTRFKPGNKKTERILAVADADSTTDGVEIITCQTDSRRPRLKMFSVDPDTYEKTKVFGVTLFADELSANRAFGGCQGLQVGDIDKDGEQEILVVKSVDRHRTADTLVYFDTSGNQEGEISLERNYLGLDHGLVTLDADGDGYNDEILLEEAIVDNDGSVLHDVYDGECSVQDVAIGDVDADGIDELVTMTGRKGKICVYDENFAVDHSFVLYPNVRAPRNRRLILGDLSELLSNL